MPTFPYNVWHFIFYMRRDGDAHFAIVYVPCASCTWFVEACSTIIYYKWLTMGSHGATAPLKNFSWCSSTRAVYFFWLSISLYFFWVGEGNRKYPAVHGTQLLAVVAKCRGSAHTEALSAPTNVAYVLCLDLRISSCVAGTCEIQKKR